MRIAAADPIYLLRITYLLTWESAPFHELWRVSRMNQFHDIVV